MHNFCENVVEIIKKKSLLNHLEIINHENLSKINMEKFPSILGKFQCNEKFL